MSDDVKHSFIWALTTAVTVCSLIWAIAWNNVATKRAAMKAGLIQKPATTQTWFYWTRPDE